MTRLNTLAPAAIFLAVAPSLAHGSDSAKAKELLFQSMTKNQHIPLTGIVLQRMSPSSDRLFQLKIDQNREGSIRLTVLQPLSLQGFTTIDDGREWLTYQPDQNRLISQPSPRLSMADPRLRINLANKNYTFKLEQGAAVAGRKTDVVVAVPKADQLPTRRYYFDKDKDFLLRLETETDNRRRLLFDTKQVSFTDVPDRVFDEDQFGPVRNIRLDPPKKFTNAESVKGAVGFKPVVPSKLPYGFVVQERQVIGSDKVQLIAIRITDGLTIATVYQYDSRRPEIARYAAQAAGAGPARAAKGIGMKMAGEVPEAVIADILDSFVKEALKGLRSFMETAYRKPLLEDVTQPEVAFECPSEEIEIEIPAPGPGQVVYVVIGR